MLAQCETHYLRSQRPLEVAASYDRQAYVGSFSAQPRHGVNRVLHALLGDEPRDAQQPESAARLSRWRYRRKLPEINAVVHNTGSAGSERTQLWNQPRLFVAGRDHEVRSARRGPSENDLFVDLLRDLR
jgi:hypothetical protein